MTYNPNLMAEKNTISSSFPWLIAVHIDNAALLAVGYDKVIADSTDFTWLDSTDTSVDFVIFPFTIPNISLEASGKFPSLSIRAFNTAEVVRIVEGNASTIIGSPVTIYFLNANALKDSSDTFVYNMETYPLQFSFIINNITIGKYLTFELGGPNYLLRLLPSKRYYRDYCDAQFRGDYCWMKDISVANDVRCDKQWESCVAHWKTYGSGVRGIKFQGFPMLNKGSMVYY